MIEQTCISEKETLYNTDILFAVFDGSEEITPKMYEEVEGFAAYVAEYQKNKKASE